MSSYNHFTWNSSGASNPGKSRTLNEDAFLNKPIAGLWAVADGMGGHSRGDHASSSVIAALDGCPVFEDLERSVAEIKQVLESINRELVQEAKERKVSIIGCTIVVFFVNRQGKFACIWAGDSRLYLQRHGVLEQISKDHSDVQSLVDQGIIKKENAENHPSANVINRAIGAENRIKLDVTYGQLRPGDNCLLCSDGLYRELFEQEINQIMKDESTPSQLVETLIKQSLQRGARDNVTVLNVRF